LELRLDQRAATETKSSKRLQNIMLVDRICCLRQQREKPSKTSEFLNPFVSSDQNRPRHQAF
jgi:hypothetical protein